MVQLFSNGVSLIYIMHSKMQDIKQILKHQASCSVNFLKNESKQLCLLRTDFIYLASLGFDVLILATI